MGVCDDGMGRGERLERLVGVAIGGLSERARRY